MRRGTSPLAHRLRANVAANGNETTALEAERVVNRALFRYAALNQDADMLSSYGGFRPLQEIIGQMPEPETLSRYSDEQLYALGRFIYSLEPPANPNVVDSLAGSGELVFTREKCSECHTPPLYTSNKLTAARGFRPPAEHLKAFDVINRSAGSDAGLATMTRRGTGYYKIPSLRGVSYRSPLEHNGSVATLEDWFDPRRVRPDYEPTGFKGRRRDGARRPRAQVRPRPLRRRPPGAHRVLENALDSLRVQPAAASAFTGSTRAARRAGNHDAASATINNAAAAAINATGSRAPT